MNEDPLKSLGDALAAAAAAWRGALPAGSVGGCERGVGSSGAVAVFGGVESMSDAGLLRVTETIAHLVREAEGVLSRVAGEIARRSPAAAGSAGLAKRQGFQTPARLIASATGGGIAGATKLVSVGEATAARRALTGEALPARHPQVAEAVAAGRISVEAAATITGMLDRIASRADASACARFERLLTEQATSLPLELLMRSLREVEARLDPDGIEPREEELRAATSLRMFEDSRSMLHINGVLDPETGAPVKAAIEALVTHSIRTDTAGSVAVGGGATGVRFPAESAGADGVGPVVADRRSIPQRQADALAMIARHVLGCHRMTDAPPMSLLVRTDLTALTDGVGYGTIDGLTQPVSAGTIRKLAASAGIIPAVLGTDSVPLDLGRSNRLFNAPQRIALGERDGGCACCALDLSYAEAHHIRWWARDNGPTDIDNGVMLCPPCHTRIHNDGWSVRATMSQVWFIPPPHVDPEQRPRLGGRARFGPPRDDLKLSGDRFAQSA